MGSNSGRDNDCVLGQKNTLSLIAFHHPVVKWFDAIVEIVDANDEQRVSTLCLLVLHDPPPHDLYIVSERLRAKFEGVVFVV